MKSENLGKGITVFTDDIHRFGTDAVLLADFARAVQVQSACDLGTGCGIIPLLWCRYEKPNRISAVDIQKSAIDLVDSAIKYNGLENRIKSILSDLKELGDDKFELVTMNPPYKSKNGGIMSECESKNIARFEIKCNLDDICSAASKLLKPTGRLCMCHRPERLADLIIYMRKNQIEPKRLRIVCQNTEKAPSLILIEGKKGGNAGMTIDPPLIIKSKSGEYTDEMEKIYYEWKKNNG